MMIGIGIGITAGVGRSDSAPQEPASPVNTALPVISGTPTVGQTLTANNGSWTGYPRPSYAKQWKRDGDAISGATGGVYELVADDYEAVITVTVTATNSEGSDDATSAGTSAVAGTAPANTVAPAISGTATVGQTLSCSTGTWTGVPTPTLAYQWKRGDANISGATSSTYELVADDYSEVITCTVTATNDVDSASLTTAGTAAVAGLAPSNSVAPAITGTATVGETLTCSSGTWAGVPTPSISYQWLRDDSPISGAESATYELVEDDEDAMVGCQVTATNAVDSVSADAEEVGPVEAAGEWSPLDLSPAAAYDHSDLASLFQSSAGTTAVTAVGNPVGYRADKSSNGDHGTQATNTARPTLSARKNWLKNTTSPVHDGGVMWECFNFGVTTDAATAPDSTTTAIEVKANSTSANTFAAFGTALSGTATASVYVKGGTRATVGFMLRNDNTPASFQSAVLTFATGVITGAGWSATDVGDGWYWVKFTQASGINPGDTVRIYLGSTAVAGTENNGKTWYIWHPQIESGTEATEYQESTSASVYDTDGFPVYLHFDAVDDKLTTTFPSLGSDCTVARAIPNIGAQILTGQSISGAWDDSTDSHYTVVVPRALDSGETDALTDFLNERAEL